MRAKASALRWPTSACAAPAISAGSLTRYTRIKLRGVNRHTPAAPYRALDIEYTA